MKKFLLMFMLMILMLSGCGDNEAKQDTASMKYRKILVVGIDDEFAPMTFRDEHKNIVGLDIDLANEAAKRMGVEM